MKLTEILAIYGATLSTLVFIWNAARAAPRVKVRLIDGIDTVNDEAQVGVYVFLQNPSSKTIHLWNLSILSQYKRSSLIEKVSTMIRYRRCPPRVDWVHSTLSNYDIEDGFPISIEPGKSHKVFIHESALKSILSDAVSMKISASTQDHLWNYTHSKNFVVTTIDIHNKSCHTTPASAPR